MTRKPFALTILAGLALSGWTSGCNVDFIIDVIGRNDHHPGRNTGGTTGGGAGGVTGTGGMTAIGSRGSTTPPMTCASLSTVVGQANRCGRIYGVAYSPDGQLLAAARQGESPNVHVWRLSDGALVHNFDGTPGG